MDFPPADQTMTNSKPEIKQVMYVHDDCYNLERTKQTEGWHIPFHLLARRVVKDFQQTAEVYNKDYKTK